MIKNYSTYNKIYEISRNDIEVGKTYIYKQIINDGISSSYNNKKCIIKFNDTHYATTRISFNDGSGNWYVNPDNLFEYDDKEYLKNYLKNIEKHRDIDPYGEEDWEY